MLLCCDTVFGGGVQEGTVPLALLSAGFPSLPLLPTIKLGPSGADSWVAWLVYILGLCWSLQWTLLWGWEFLPLLPQPALVFSIKGLRLYFLPLELYVFLLPSCSSQVICTQMWNHPVGNPLPHRVLQPPPCRESSLSSCPSPPFLPVWMNVSSLTPWSSDFHTVRFSVGSGWFCSYICCCPSFGCVRRHSVSTYASILAGSHKSWFKISKTDSSIGKYNW